MSQEIRKNINENEDQVPLSKPQSLVDVNSTKNPNLTIPNIMYDSDNDFTIRTRWRIKSEVQAGQVSGHFVRIQNGKVSADATYNDSKAQVKIHLFYDDILNEDLWIIESVSDPGNAIAIENNKVVVKSTRSNLTSITNVQAMEPEILFIKKPIGIGSCIFTLKSKSSSTNCYLGFDKINGSVMDPTKVRPTQREARFKIL